MIRGLIERRAGRAYVAGDSLEDALGVCRALARRDIRSVVCFWAHGQDSPALVSDRYLATARALAAEGIPAHLSAKAAALGFDHGRFEDLMAAMPAGTRLHVDSRGPEEQDRALAIAEGLAGDRPGAVGVTLPSRWRRSADDARRLADADVSVRLVKGQWPDPDGDIDSHRAFLDLAGAVATPGRLVGVATHDHDLAEASFRILGGAEGVRMELEQLFGFPVHRTFPVARSAGIPVRVYVPYSRTRPLPYSIRRAVRAPRVMGWLAQDLVAGGHKRHTVAALLRT